MSIAWFHNAISNEYIQCYPREEFTNIGEGRFGLVSSGEWPRANRRVALKKLKKYDVKRVASEVKMHFKSHSSKNVVRFLGLTKEIEELEYIMVFEYADLNNLRMFLQKDTNLPWDGKLKLSLDIANGLDYVHSLNIVHRDLHSKNIVINQLHKCDKFEYIAKITDFSSAIIMNDEEHVDDIIEKQIPFTDPKYLNDRRNHKKNFKSDIYSLGVIFWEISSHKIPFIDYMTDSRSVFRELCLMLEVIGGKRERRVPRTPENYIKLYQNCWKFEENERPNISQVIDTISSESLSITLMKDNTLNTCESKEDKIKYDITKNELDNTSISQNNIYKSEEDEIKYINKDQITNVKNLRKNINSGVILTNNSEVIIKKLHSEEIKSNLSQLNNMFKISKQSNNIVEILGVVKDENNWFLITPLPHDGNLRDYLKNKNGTLDKIKIATNIAEGVLFLHKEHNIIHGDLHPKNILMFDGMAKISGLPLPYEKYEYINQCFFDQAAYCDPDSLSKLSNENFEKKKSMDIYSLGSLLWEIMSEKVPYSNYKGHLKPFVEEIKNGYRETDIIDIPAKYAKYIDLYKKCWDKDSLARPKIEDVCDKLNALL